MTRQEENKILYDIKIYEERLKQDPLYFRMTDKDKKRKIIKDSLFFAFRNSYSASKSENNAEISCETVIRLFDSIDKGNL